MASNPLSLNFTTIIVKTPENFNKNKNSRVYEDVLSGSKYIQDSGVKTVLACRAAML